MAASPEASERSDASEFTGYVITGLNESSVMGKIFSGRLDELKKDWRACMEKCSVAKGVSPEEAFEYFARRDITGEPLIQAASILQRAATLYRLYAKTGGGDSRRRMFRLLYSFALAVAAKERLKQVHPRAAFESSGGDPAGEEGLQTGKTDRNEPGGPQTSQSTDLFSFKVEHRSKTEIRIEDAEKIIEGIENDIQMYAGTKSPLGLRDFSDNMFGKVTRMREGRYDYKNAEGKDVDVPKVRRVMEETVENFVDIMNEISDFCIGHLGAPPCEFAHVGMGSLARQDATPYSDFENLILLEDGGHGEEVYDYFRWYALIFQCVIIRFGETPLRSFAIPEFNDFNSEDPRKNWLWDDVLNPGIRFDSIHPVASKVPLGSLETEMEKYMNLLKPFLPKDYLDILSNAVVFLLDDSLEQELIKPVSDMAKLFFDEMSHIGEDVKVKLLNEVREITSYLRTKGVQKVVFDKIEELRHFLQDETLVFDDTARHEVLEMILGIANLLREKKMDKRMSWHVREVLVFSRFVAGSRKLHEEFDRMKLERMLKLPYAYNTKRLRDTFRDFVKYFPKIDITKQCGTELGSTDSDLPIQGSLDFEFKHGSKDIFHRLVCCFLTAVGRLHGLYFGTIFDFIQGLHSREVFSLRAKENLEFLVTSIYAWRDATYASLGSQEDYFFGLNDGVITSAALLKGNAFQPNFSKMCSILIECRNLLHHYFTLNKDEVSVKDIFSKSNLTSIDEDSVQDACDLFGFTKTDITTCSNSGSAFALFGCLYVAVFSRRTQIYSIKKGMESSSNSRTKSTPSQSDAPKVFHLPQPGSSTQSPVTVQFPSSSGVAKIEIPRQLISQNKFTPIFIPDSGTTSFPSPSTGATQPEPGTIQLTPEMLTGNQVTMIRLPQPGTSQEQSETAQFPLSQLPSVLAQMNIPSDAWQNLSGGFGQFPGFSSNAMFSTMVAQGAMNAPRRNMREDIEKFAKTTVRKESLRRELGNFFAQQGSNLNGQDGASTSNPGTQETNLTSPSELGAANLPDLREESAEDKTERSKGIIKSLLAQIATNGSLAGLLGSNFTAMAKKLIGEEAAAAFGGKNPIVTFMAKLFLPNISLCSLVSKEERLLLLSIFRVDHIEFEEYIMEKEGTNPFLFPDTEDNCMDALFEFASLAINHDGSNEMTSECRTKFSEVANKLSKVGFLSVATFNTALRTFSHMVGSGQLAIRKLENMHL